MGLKNHRIWEEQGSKVQEKETCQESGYTRNYWRVNDLNEADLILGTKWEITRDLENGTKL